MRQRINYWSKYCLKSYVSRLVLKAGEEKLWQRTKGRGLQICAAEKQKARLPCCFLLKVGMREVLSSEEEHRDLEGMNIWTSSAKYWGAVPMMIWQQRQAVLYLILYHAFRHMEKIHITEMCLGACMHMCARAQVLYVWLHGHICVRMCKSALLHVWEGMHVCARVHMHMYACPWVAANKSSPDYAGM